MDFAERLVYARKRHPHFTENPEDGLRVILNELAELSHAIKYERSRRIYDEALDVCVKAFRLANGEADAE